jgi:hypothetical protein
VEAPKNPIIDTVNRAIDALAMEVAYNLAVQGLEAEAPWLKLPVIRQVFEFVTKTVFEKTSQNLQIAADFAIIDAQASAEKKACSEAVKLIKEAPTDANKQKFKDAYAKLIHANGGLRGPNP